MQVSFAILVALVLLGSIYSASIPTQFDRDLIQTEVQFLASLTPQQRNIWNSIKDQLVHGAINTVLSSVLGKRNVDNAETELFLESLTPQQRNIWNSIKDQLV
ncbi:unnamed protein product, partial [Adineta steineri]